MSTMAAELAVLFALVLLNGLLAAAEIAIVGIDRVRLKQHSEAKRRGAQAVVALRANPERFFATVQIGITVIGATAGAFGGATFAADLEPLLAGVPVLGPYAAHISFALVVALISFMSVILGELVPKSLALRHANSYALTMAPLVLGLSSLARPLVWFLTACSNVILSLFGDKTTFSETRLSPQELSELVDEAAQTGSIHPAAGEIASRALAFSRLTAAHVMVPRSRVVAMDRAWHPDEIKRIALEHAYSRFPVYENVLDNVIGYVLVKDMLSMAFERQLIVLDDMVRPPYFVIKTTSAATLLQEMRRQRTHLAIVVDEHGGTSGIVTIEDLLEELVGEIFSEVATAEVESIRILVDGAALVEGEAAIRDINRELELELPEGEHWSTIGGLCVALAEHVPKAGEVLTAPDGTRLEVEAATERRVLRVRITRAPI
jgi:putative hemolysin